MSNNVEDYSKSYKLKYFSYWLASVPVSSTSIRLGTSLPVVICVRERVVWIETTSMFDILCNDTKFMWVQYNIYELYLRFNGPITIMELNEINWRDESPNYLYIDLLIKQKN